jgi:AraC-like DNA-binding protein
MATRPSPTKSQRLLYADARPKSAALVPVIERYWVVRGDRLPASRGVQAAEHIVPDGCPELIVHVGDPFERLVRGRWVRQPRAFLAGTLTRPWHVRPGRRAITLGIRFRPGMVRAIFALDMKTATDREVELRDVVHPDDAIELVHAVFGDALPRVRPSALFAIAERWLVRRIEQARTRPAATTPAAVRRILIRRGRERIDDLARALGVTRRSLERAFAKDLGISPKRFARIVRLNAVLASLGREQRAGAVDVAIEAGYFDQSHLARDFRNVAGRRSTRAREHDGAMASRFTDPDRLLALLDGE